MAAASRILFCICLSIIPALSLIADDDVFARQGDIVLTQAELDAAFLQVPEHIRHAFIRDGGKVDQLVQSLLRFKQLAADASRNDYDKEKLIALRMSLAGDKELAEAWIQNTMENAPDADYEAMAHERYLANPAEFMSVKTVDVSHILIAVDENRSDEEALELASSLRQELLESPALFDDYILQYSEDPGIEINQGRYAQVVPGQMVKPFEDMVFSMTEPGQISEPVKTSFGYHIIRLNKATPSRPLPFDSVKEQLEAEARETYLLGYRRNFILNLSADPIEIPEGAVETMIKRHFGENLELAPANYKQ